MNGRSSTAARTASPCSTRPAWSGSGIPAAHRITGTAAADAIGKPPSFPLPEPGSTLNCKLPNGRWLDVLCTSLADGGGELVIDFRDVTAAKELEEAKDLFLATTSHELRTPITVVQGFASTLASRWDQLPDTERRAAVRIIAERAGSLGRLVEQLLLGSRAGADQLPVSNGPFDLAAVLHGAAAAFRPLSDKHAVVADIPAGLPRASGDTMATDIIVGQLLENAFKYSPDGGTVRVRAQVTGEWIEVTVEDEGIGIADGDHERIFDRFFQGEAGDRRRFGGVGIGLFIVRRLAEAQHGEVTATSRPAGGTVDVPAPAAGQRLGPCPPRDAAPRPERGAARAVRPLHDQNRHSGMGDLGQ